MTRQVNLLCIATGHVEAVRLLLAEYPPLIDIVDEAGHTALQWATIYGHAQVMEPLLGKEANPLENDGNSDGQNVLHWGASYGTK